MARRKNFLKLQALSRLEVAAVACAALLSVSCFARGAVDDATIAVMLLLSLPVLWAAGSGTKPVYAPLKYMGSALLACILFIFCLQYLASAAPHDAAAAFQGAGRLLFFTIIFTTALFIGACESSSRIFLNALLLSGTGLVAVTFFAANRDGAATGEHYYYAHGFVNANNAAVYLGVILLLSLAQAVRFFRVPAKPMLRAFLDFIDHLNGFVIIKGGFLLFAVLLALAGLFMTGSRGGIALSLLCAALFSFMMLFKINLQGTARTMAIAAVTVVTTALISWSFINFGHIITAKLNTDGINPNSRFEIFSAVLPMIADHPLLGTGLGSFPGAFQAYRPETISTDGIIDKAHNSYLEFSAEMGIPALLVLLFVLGRAGQLLYGGVKGRRERYVVPALGLSVWLLAALVSLIDFPLQIPGLTALFIAIITICVSQTDARFCQSVPTSSSAVIKRRRIRKRRSAAAMIPPPII